MKPYIAKCTECGKVTEIVESGFHKSIRNGSVMKAKRVCEYRHCQACIDADQLRWEAHVKQMQDEMRAAAEDMGIDTSDW